MVKRRGHTVARRCGFEVVWCLKNMMQDAVLYDLYAVDSDMTIMMNRREVVPWPAQGSRNGICVAGSLN